VIETLLTEARLIPGLATDLTRDARLHGHALLPRPGRLAKLLLASARLTKLLLASARLAKLLLADARLAELAMELRLLKLRLELLAHQPGLTKLRLLKLLHAELLLSGKTGLLHPERRTVQPCQRPGLDLWRHTGREHRECLRRRWRHRSDGDQCLIGFAQCAVGRLHGLLALGGGLLLRECADRLMQLLDRHFKRYRGLHAHHARLHHAQLAKLRVRLSGADTRPIELLLVREPELAGLLELLRTPAVLLLLPGLSVQLLLPHLARLLELLCFPAILLLLPGLRLEMLLPELARLLELLRSPAVLLLLPGLGMELLLRQVQLTRLMKLAVLLPKPGLPIELLLTRESHMARHAVILHAVPRWLLPGLLAELLMLRPRVHITRASHAGDRAPADQHGDCARGTNRSQFPHGSSVERKKITRMRRA
jgi:hypothetical protein